LTYLALTIHPEGVETGPGDHVVYDMIADQAVFGAAHIEGHALVFAVGEEAAANALLAVRLEVEPGRWLLRCDRIDFPSGGIAYTHTHPGPGIRCQLFGRLTVTSGGHTRTFQRLQPWFESGPEPVYAEASADGPAAFVRVLVLPPEWAGRRTIEYVNPEDAERPTLQRATVFGEAEIAI
jgi:hypothetical protein